MERPAQSKIAPCLWFASEAEEAANFYVSLIPDSRVDHVQRNTIDAPGGKKDTVLMVEFTLAGQRFQALNGGSKATYTHALSLSVDCADQAELDRIWNGLLEGGAPQQCGWLSDRWGVNWQIVPAELRSVMANAKNGPAVMQALLGMVKLDIATLKAAARS